MSGEGMPSREELVKQIETLQKAQKAQADAKNLQSKARVFTDSKEREKYVRESYDKEVKEHGEGSKWARRIASGPFQGLAAGGGIGAAAGLGLGTGLGVVLGGLLSLPTTGVGALVGTGVGAVRGPFIKLGGKNVKLEDANPEEVAEAIEQEQKRMEGQQIEMKVEDGPVSPEEVAKDPTRDEPRTPQLRQRNPNKKPRKIEVRSGNTPGRTTSSDSIKRPRKLEVRSPSQDYAR